MLWMSSWKFMELNDQGWNWSWICQLFDELSLVQFQTLWVWRGCLSSVRYRHFESLELTASYSGVFKPTESFSKSLRSCSFLVQAHILRVKHKVKESRVTPKIHHCERHHSEPRMRISFETFPESCPDTIGKKLWLRLISDWDYLHIWGMRQVKIS